MNSVWPAEHQVLLPAETQVSPLPQLKITKYFQNEAIATASVRNFNCRMTRFKHRLYRCGGS